MISPAKAQPPCVIHKPIKGNPYSILQVIKEIPAQSKQLVHSHLQNYLKTVFNFRYVIYNINWRELKGVNLFHSWVFTNFNSLSRFCTYTCISWCSVSSDITLMSTALYVTQTKATEEARPCLSKFYVLQGRDFFDVVVYW